MGLGTYAMTGDAEADETGTTDQTMYYNSTTGTFDNMEGDPEDQEGVGEEQVRKVPQDAAGRIDQQPLC